MRDRSFVDELLQWRKNRVSYVSEEIFFFMHDSSDKGGQKLHASFQQYKHCLVVVVYSPSPGWGGQSWIGT